MALNRKQKLFQLGQDALSIACGKVAPGYVCPICLRGFESVDELTEEHVPPKSINGKVLCLTCPKCNCGCGDTIDASIHNEVNFKMFGVRDGKPKRAKIVDEGLEVNIEIIFESGKIRIKVLGKQNNPKIIEKMKASLLEKIKAKKEFHIKHYSYHTIRQADIGYLKSAYLILFAKLGYRYILRPSLNRIRQQILYPSDNILNTVRMFINVPETTIPAIYWIKTPISCLGVRFFDSIVCLPHPDGDDCFYEFFTKTKTKQKQHEFKVSGTMPWPLKFEAVFDFR